MNPHEEKDETTFGQIRKRGRFIFNGKIWIRTRGHFARPDKPESFSIIFDLKTVVTRYVSSSDRGAAFTSPPKP